MIHFDIPKQKSSILKVIGVGGGGSNAVNHMYLQNIDSVDFIICNTDAQALASSKVPNKIQLGPHLTQGLGAGANPEIGKQATEESLEEIKRILEVNTKMAFITAGMGGGTGTGGAPIISKICKELGILTVGIVTTPFSNEGPKRMRHAENGIKFLRDNVDTLLVISNDKLRQQYGNLKVRDAFSKADNILATASKCITDVITSNGQINVDFADVCTVMRNGGVAILGSAVAEGEDRAQRAIEDAVNSPLLNDSEIRGAKWILVNITSAEGEHEITMDEEDTIMSYLRQEAGEDTDVIKGIGFDETLGTKLGVTIIATGFESKDPFRAPLVVKEQRKEEKIVMTLGVQDEEKKLYAKPAPLTVEEKDPFAPTLVEEQPDTKAFVMQPVVQAPQAQLQKEEAPKMVLQMPVAEEPVELNKTEAGEPLHFELKTEPQDEVKMNAGDTHQVHEVAKEEVKEVAHSKNENASVRTPGGFLSKPANIYAQPGNKEPVTELKEQPVSPTAELQGLELKLHVKETKETPTEVQPPVVATQSQPSEELPLTDEADDQKRKAAERIQKLRNLSFNMNAADPNNEFEAVPAYIRRNMEMFGNTLTSVENFYSKYTVKTDENNKTEINSINTFLDGKKPD